MTEQIDAVQKDCRTCVYGYTCSQPKEEGRPRDDCLDGDDHMPSPYRHYEKGDPRTRLLELQRSGEIDIVIGGEGEHCVNVNWSMKEARKRLGNVCEECGGLCWTEGNLIVLDKPYNGGFKLEYKDDKLVKISMETRATPLHTWWTAE